MQIWLVDRMKIWIQSSLSVSSSLSSRALRHAVFHARHVAIHKRHVAHHLLKRHHAPFNYCHVQLKPTLINCDWLNTFITIILGIHTYGITNHVAIHKRHVAHHLLKRHHAPFNYCHVQLKPTLINCDWLNTFITIILGIHTYGITNAWWSRGVFTVVVTGGAYTSNWLPSRWWL